MRTTNKLVIERIQKHILTQFDAEHYDNESDNSPTQNLVEQLDYMRYGNRSIYQTALDWVEGGSALIYHIEVKEFLNSLDINPTGTEYTDEKSWKLYCHLVAREMSKLYEGAK